MSTNTVSECTLWYTEHTRNPAEVTSDTSETTSNSFVVWNYDSAVSSITGRSAVSLSLNGSNMRTMEFAMARTSISSYRVMLRRLWMDLLVRLRYK